MTRPKDEVALTLNWKRFDKTPNHHRKSADPPAKGTPFFVYACLNGKHYYSIATKGKGGVIKDDGCLPVHAQWTHWAKFTLIPPTD